MMDRLQLEQRNYTLAQALYRVPDVSWPNGYRPESRYFLVGTPFVREARPRAAAYAELQWGVPITIEFYPRNYIRQARELFAAGKVC